MLRWAKKKKDRLKLCTIYQHQVTFALPYHSSTNFWLHTCVKTNIILKNKKYHNELQWHSLPWLQTIQRMPHSGSQAFSWHPRFDVRLIHNRKRIPQWRQVGHLENYVAFQTVPFYATTKYTRSLFFVGGNYWLKFYTVFLLWSVYIFWIKNEGVFNRREEVHDILLLN